MKSRTWTLLFSLVTIATLGCDDPLRFITPPPSDSLGTLQVWIAVTGTFSDPDGYAVVVAAEGEDDDDPYLVPSTGGLAVFPDLLRGTYSVHLESLDGSCSVWGDVEHSVVIHGGLTVPTWFVVDCPASSTRQVFERVDPTVYDRLERYVIEVDSSFQFQTNSDKGGFFETLGTYSSVGDTLVFYLNDLWGVATGTFADDCLLIVYDIYAAIEGYEDGKFCRSSGG